MNTFKSLRPRKVSSMDYPASIVPVNHVAPVPRRIRAYLGAEKVLDTTRALYVWRSEEHTSELQSLV